MNNRNEIPFIHLFSTPLGYYFYDVNTNDIVKVNGETYEFLQSGTTKYMELVQKELNDLKRSGYLKTNHVEQTLHPLTELLPFYAESKLGQLILQVTQNCNLRCDYCVYSGNYETRGHTNKRMHINMAKKAIDFFRDHTKDQKEVTIGFYGGEPLLEFPLIKECVNYAEQRLKGKNIEYSITTNATLLSDEVIEYFISNNFFVTISLDGPKEIQDECRRFLHSNKGTFDVVMRNLKKIKERDSDYFDRNVRVNTVLVVERGYECIEEFFKGEEVFSNLSISSSVVSDNYSKTKRKLSEEFHIEQQYELFKTFLAEMDKLPKNNSSSLLRGYLKRIYQLCGEAEQKHREELPKKWHRGGPCLPGVMRLFVTVEGTLLPCERVCEISECAQIGTIDKGFNIEKMNEILNIEKITEIECKKCWAYSECSSCIRFGNSCKDTIKATLLSRCAEIRANIEGAFKDYTVLQELGYDFDELEVTV